MLVMLVFPKLLVRMNLLETKQHAGLRLGRASPEAFWSDEKV